MEIIFLLIGLLVGGGSAYLISHFLHKTGAKVSSEKEGIIQKELSMLKTELEQRDKEIISLNRLLSAKDSDFRNIQERLKEKKEEIESLNDKLTHQFKNIATQIMEENTKKFTDQNKTNLDTILKPLGEKLTDFRKKVEEVYIDEAKERSSLKEQVKQLADLNQQVSKEAQALTHALKGDSKVQGDWGEMILESILEKSGLTRDREYSMQESFTEEGGRRLRTDAIVKYPGERSIVIDSKVSLTAYENYCNAQDDEAGASALKAHLLSVKNHINELATKNYQDIYQLKTLDFVMMFIPVEPAYMLAVQADNNLWSYAYDKRVLLISPTNLIAALKMVESMWRQEYQNRNAQEIAERGGNLYDKFTNFVEDLKKLGNQLDTTKSTYVQAMTKLTEGRGNLIRQAEMMRELGIKNSKNLDSRIVERSGEA